MVDLMSSLQIAALPGLEQQLWIATYPTTVKSSLQIWMAFTIVLLQLASTGAARPKKELPSMAEG